MAACPEYTRDYALVEALGLGEVTKVEPNLLLAFSITYAKVEPLNMPLGIGIDP